MLIRIDNSILVNQNINDLSNEVLTTLELLAWARREGKHAVIGERETLKQLSECTQLSKLAREVYFILYNDFTKFRTYISFVTQYIEIVSPCIEPNLLSINNKIIIRISPKLIQDSESVQKTLFLCEDLSDCVFYEFVAKVCQVWRQQRVYLACEHKGGGGNRIGNEYENVQKNKQRLCICIVDSDRIAPKGKLGDTASKINTLSNPDWVKTKLLILDMHEIENLIPNVILEQVYLSNKDKQKSLIIFNEIQNSSAVSLKSFLDVKKGSSMKEIVSSCNPDVKSFWNSKIFTIPNINERIDLWCLNNWQCSNADKNTKDCKCSISLGFGDHVIDNTILHLDQKSIHNIAQLVASDNYLRPEWEKVGQVIIDWCFAERPMRV